MWSPVGRLSPLVALPAINKWTGPDAVAGGLQCTVHTPVIEGAVCSIHDRPVPAVQPPEGVICPSEQMTRWSAPALNVPAGALLGALSDRAVNSNPNVAALLSDTVTVRSCALPGV